MNNKAFNRFFYVALATLAAIYWLGMQLPLMNVDASTYAELSKQMFQSGNYLQLYLDGVDYLDKPPLVFWSACLSFKLFGIHDWAYRLPSVLCLALGIYSVYRYAKLFYSEQAAKMAALIMASCMACYVMTSDVRTDTMLTGWVMFSLWQLAAFNQSLKIKNMLLGAVGIGFAMLAKGPIGLIVPVTAFAVEFAYKRQWKNFFRWQYLIAIVVIAIVLLPMSYGLYEQFDLHPEKKMYGDFGTSGLRFFYWTQSFGRITGESTWSNNPDPFFLFHSFLWSFAPWCIFFIPALYTGIRNIIRRIADKKSGIAEIMSISGFVVILIFLSRSKYQLPHYSFVIHPLAAIITAHYLDEHFSSSIKSRLFSVFYVIHIFLIVLIFALLFLMVFFIFPTSIMLSLLIVLTFCIFIYILCFVKFNLFPKVYLLTLIAFATLTFVLNIHFYPSVLAYQPGSEISKYLNKTAPDGSKLLLYKSYHDYSMEFYSTFPIVEYVNQQTLTPDLVRGKTFILADTAYVKTIQTINRDITIIEKYQSHSPTVLNWKFLNPSTRASTVGNCVLMKY